MIDVLKQSALLFKQLIGLFSIAEKSFDLCELIKVVGFSVSAEVPVFIIASQVSSSFVDIDDASGF